MSEPHFQPGKFSLGRGSKWECVPSTPPGLHEGETPDNKSPKCLLSHSRACPTRHSWSKAHRQLQSAIREWGSRREPRLFLLLEPQESGLRPSREGPELTISISSRCYSREAETKGERKQREGAGTYEKAVLADLPGTLQSDRAAGGSAAHRSAVRGAGFATATKPPRAALGTARYSVRSQLKDPT